MDPNLKPVLVPRYMRDFSCIGADCEDSCCVGWAVNIDEITYQKYQRIQHKDLKPLIKEKIPKNLNQNPRDYARISLNQDHTCPFLTGTKLCQIQLNVGEDYLSDTCSLYPRYINQVDESMEKSATVSCPEFARLALLNPEGIEFDQVEENQIRKVIHRNLKTEGKENIDKPQRFLWEIRIFTIEVLQYRMHSMSDRLIFLGMFYNELQSYINEKKISSIPQLIRNYRELIQNDEVKQSIRTLSSDFTIQMQLLKELTDERIYLGITSKRYLECLEEMLKGIQYSEESEVTEIASRYQLAYEQYYHPFMKEHDYILENYLVNYVFKNLFPFGDYPTVFEEYAMLMVQYSLIKLHLIGMAGYHKGLDTDLVIKLIQSFAKTIEHSLPYLRNIYTLLQRNDYLTLPYITILIKND